jgi:hypothetical protein
MKTKKKTMKKKTKKKRFTYIRPVVTSTLLWDVMQRRFVVADVSGQPIGPMFDGQAVQDACRNTGAPLYREWRGL